jgi:hypothetical protein
MDKNSEYIVRDVGPKEAEVLLGKNQRNRRINKNTVDEYANLMISGKWHPDADTPIKLSYEDQLLDGQHRLMAVVESGVTLPFTFKTNCDPSAQQHMDRGRKRSLSDDLYMHGYRYTTLLASSLSTLHTYLTTEKIANHVSSIDFDTAMSMLDEFPEFIDIATHASSRVQMARQINGDSPLVASEATVIQFLTNRTSRSEYSSEFIEQILFGHSLEQNPVNAFKRAIVQEKRHSKSRTLSKTYLYSMAFTTWNKWVKDEKVKYIKIPRIFPKLEGFQNPWVAQSPPSEKESS